MLRGKLLAVRDKRVRPGLDDKVLADWNGMMIAALVNAGVAVRRAGWIADGGARLPVHRAQDDQGDRLGHSWREGRLLFPGLASDFANMIRAALALHEATGERDYLDARWPGRRALDRHYANAGQRRLLPHRRRRRGPGGAAGRDQRRRHAQSQRGRRAEPGAARGAAPATTPGASRPTACSTACCGARGDNLFIHVALLNALDLRLRGAEIVDHRHRRRADALSRRR